MPQYLPDPGYQNPQDEINYMPLPESELMPASDTVSLFEIRDLHQQTIIGMRAFIRGHEVDWDPSGKPIIKMNKDAKRRVGIKGEKLIIDTLNNYLNPNVVLSYLDKQGASNLMHLVKKVLKKKFTIDHHELGIDKTDREYILTIIISMVYLAATRAIEGRTARARAVQKKILETITHKAGGQNIQPGMQPVKKGLFSGFMHK